MVEALVEAVKANYKNLAHRYYRLKAKWFGVRKLNTWDRNATLPEDSNRRYSWDQAKEVVLSAYGGFAPEMAAIAGRFFAQRWIDAPPIPGKKVSTLHRSNAVRSRSKSASSTASAVST